MDQSIDTRTDLFLFIGHGSTALCLDAASGESFLIESSKVADALEVPKILPIPQSEEDPRELPRELSYLYVPSTDTYTLATRIFDTELENKHRLISNRSGIVASQAHDVITTYDLQITEGLLDGLGTRVSEFDREIIVLIELGERIHLGVKPLGDVQERRLTDNKFKVRVFREGMIIDIKNNKGKTIKCVPTTASKQLIDQILQNAQDLEL